MESFVLKKIAILNYSDARGGAEKWSHFFVDYLNQNGESAQFVSVRVFFSSFIMFWRYVKIIRTFDILHFNNCELFYALATAYIFKRRETKIVLHIHNVGKKNLAYRIKYLLSRLFSDHVFFVSELSRQNHSHVDNDCVFPSYIPFSETCLYTDREVIASDLTVAFAIGNWRLVKRFGDFIELARRFENDPHFEFKLFCSDFPDAIENLPDNLVVVRNCFTPFDFVPKNAIFIGCSESEGLGLAAVEAQFQNHHAILSCGYPAECVISDNVKFFPVGHLDVLEYTLTHFSKHMTVSVDDVNIQREYTSNIYHIIESVYFRSLFGENSK